MRGGHGDDEGEHVVDEGVEGFVHEGAPRERGHGPQAVVHEQLRQHEQEAERVHAVHYAVQRPRVPTGKIRWLVWGSVAKRFYLEQSRAKRVLVLQL